ncbi:hypothetical protein [Thermomonas sp.]|uniref:hypothetical protein n=1 Tax=Thermomonas sp. TaxID=1971895 RepID=UPI00248714F6|nr:hypothetical protein [Thermomonas sp.]MDI1254068.1 hypothetical protein [Thermomonas sp.]
MQSITAPPTRKASIAPPGPACDSHEPMDVTQPTPIIDPNASAKKPSRCSPRFNSGLAMADTDPLLFMGAPSERGVALGGIVRGKQKHRLLKPLDDGPRRQSITAGSSVLPVELRM